MARRKNAKQKLAGPSGEPDGRDLEIYHAVCEGRLSQRDIGKKFNMSQQGVSKLFKRVNDWMVPQMMTDIRAIKTAHTQSLMNIYRESIRAWHKSKRDFVQIEESLGTSNSDGKSPDHEGEGLETKRTTRKQAGAIQCLSQAQAALKDIRVIWGADAPLKDNGEEEERIGGLSREEARKILLEEMKALEKSLESGGD